jgi:hypothetical protein
MIAIDNDLDQLIKDIPPEKSIDEIEIPSGICESAAAIVSLAISREKEFQIENRELRILLNRVWRMLLLIIECHL